MKTADLLQVISLNDRAEKINTVLKLVLDLQSEPVNEQEKSVLQYVYNELHDISNDRINEGIKLLNNLND